MRRGSPHPPQVRAAAEALLRETSLPMAAIARQLGLSDSTIRSWNADEQIRQDRRREPAAPAIGSAPVATPDRAGLEAALRRHIARQIAALDALLDTPERETDSARVLRDLGGLKRLLDDLPAEDRPGPRGRPDHSEGAADEGAGDDLPALRAAIARRLEGDRKSVV